jgi:type II secretory pathway pseudopilin PulG
MVRSARAQRGYTYLALMFAVALMGAGLAAAGVFWHTAQMREKERELLYVGDQYKKAIERYYKQGKTYPRELPQLVRDQRTPDVRRYIRKLYRDPITNKNEWGLLKTPDGGIAGIFSLSEQAPLKTANFPLAYAEFEGKTKYSDWKFVYSPQSAPGGTGAPGAAQQRAPGTPAGAQPNVPGGTAGGQQSANPASGPARAGAVQGAQSGASNTGGFQLGTTSDAAPGQQGSASGAQSTGPGGFGLLQPSTPSSGGAGAVQPSTPATDSGAGAQESFPRTSP